MRAEGTRMIRAADLFCGAGGTTTGLLHACNDLGFRLELTAVNHWPLAIQTHMANHPWARHLCTSLTAIDLGETGLFPSIDAVDPRKAVPGGKLDVLVASPECTHHSNARGGKPRSDQSRSTPWCILRWADALHPGVILIENVPEFRTWGPLGSKGKPLKSRRGDTYRAFLTALDSLGYRVEDRVLNAADYGDATTRKRLFIQAVRGRRAVTWPEPTHAKAGAGGLEPWRPARDIIDWRLPGRSIFGRKRPLAANTLRRIATGIKKFWGPLAEPFLVMLYGTNDARSVERPLPTVTAGGGHIGLAEPFLVRYQGGPDSAQRVHSCDEPLPVQDTSNRYGVCEAFLLGQQSCAAPRGVDNPAPTIATKGAISLVEPFITSFAHTHKEGPRNYGVDRPLPTQTGTRTFGGGHLVEPFLTKFYGTGGAVPVGDPLGTVTTKERFALVEPGVVELDGERYALDIRFRMLQPHELAAAMSFPDAYAFAGTKDQKVKQIGNAVAVRTARALCHRALAAA